MSSIVELLKGEGGADAWVRRILLALLFAVSVALVWITLSGREARSAGAALLEEASGLVESGASPDDTGAPARDETYLSSVQ